MQGANPARIPKKNGVFFNSQSKVGISFEYFECGVQSRLVKKNKIKIPASIEVNAPKKLMVKRSGVKPGKTNLGTWVIKTVTDAMIIFAQIKPNP